MANKIAKSTMLLTLFSTAFLGLSLTSGEIDNVSTPTKTAVSYASEDDMNDHDSDHSSDYSWVSLEQSDFNTGGTYADGYLPGGYTESEMTYYYLKEDVTLSTILTISYNNFVTICLNGKTLTGTNSDSVITIYGSAGLTLCDCSGDDSGTITGGNATYGGGVHNGGTFTMNGGTITGNEATGDGGGIYSIDGTFTMYGGTISANEAEFGGGVFVCYSTFNMYGGTISSNEATAAGGVNVTGTFNMYDGTISSNELTSDSGSAGGVSVVGTFNMYGGTISSNEATTAGGGVNVTGEFNMYDGTISSNEATNGGGVLVSINAVAFNMNGGTITGNTATSRGGGVYVQSNGFAMYDGVISSNNATDEGGGIYVGNSSSSNMYGGTVSSNTASSGNGFSVDYTCTLYIHGGFLGNDISSTWGDTYIYGGYFSETAYSSIESYIDTDYIGVNIYTLGTDLDDNYVEGYPYAVYIKSSSTYQIENVTISYGTSYTPTITGFDGYVTYTWVDSNDSNNTGTGLPSDVGDYSVTAYIFEVNTVDEETTISVATCTFTVTIS